jgi:hypothetical protein
MRASTPIGCRTPHAQCHDEPNHRTQAPPASRKESYSFARILRVSAMAPNLVRVIRRLRFENIGADERLSPSAGLVSRAPRKRRGLSVVKCLSACLVGEDACHQRPACPGRVVRGALARVSAPPLSRRRTHRTAGRARQISTSVPTVPLMPQLRRKMRAPAVMSSGRPTASANRPKATRGANRPEPGPMSSAR